MTAEKAQLEIDTKQHQADRAEAKAAIEQAEAIRAKEAAAFAKESSSLSSNVDALSKAIAALEKGVAGGFLQTTGAQGLRRLTLSVDMSATDRDMLSSFLSGRSGYIPQSGEIIGILKQMKDEMAKDLADAEAAEATAQADHKALVEAKAKQIRALTEAIEEKLKRVGDLGVKLAETKNDLQDTSDGLAEDQQFLADLDKNCDLKKAEWAEYQRVHAEELVAIADTIKILNDDDALELFKKTLPSAASLLQEKVGARQLRRRALAALRHLVHFGGGDARFDFVQTALHGKKIGFEKVIKMIDDLV